MKTIVARLNVVKRKIKNRRMIKNKTIKDRKLRIVLSVKLNQDQLFIKENRCVRLVLYEMLNINVE